jgi:RND family efflux transporter MFP subunit
MKLGPKALLPAAVLAGALATSGALVLARPVPEAQGVEEHRPVVAVVPAAPGIERMLVRAQGTVEPRTENELLAEVGGRLAWVSPALETGSFFAAGEVLARIEPADYEIAVERARAALERTRSQHELAEANLARSRALREAGAASQAAHDQAESNAAIAAANRREAEAALRQAELELARTELRVPFAGRVREKKADVGQQLARGAPIASVFAVDWAELRLAIRSDDLAFLELPRAPLTPDAGPVVRLSGHYAGRRHTWSGHLVRAEGSLDPRTRLVHVVARVEDPYGLASGRPPLEVGLFVDAEIEGREVPGAMRLPRGALRGDSEVVVVGDGAALRTRRVEVLRIDGETVFVAGGLAAGERVVARVPSTFVEGMKVRVGEQLVAAAAASPPRAAPSPP